MRKPRCNCGFLAKPKEIFHPDPYCRLHSKKRGEEMEKSGLVRTTYSDLSTGKDTGETLTEKKLKKLFKDANKAVYADGAPSLMYKGKPVFARNFVPKGEVWFITENNFVIGKYPDDKKFSFVERWYICLKTLWMEFRGY